MIQSEPQPVAVVLSLFDTGLAAVRALGRAGVRVIGLDPNPQMPGVKSKYCSARVCPDPVHQPEELVRFLLDLGRNLDQPGILFPASDAFVLFCSRYRDTLRECFRFALPSAEILEAMVNKREQYEMAERVGTPYATTFYPETAEDVRQIKDRLDYPAFIKPYYGHLWREHFGGSHKGFKVHTAEELVARFEEIFPTGLQAMVQSIILGPNTNHYKVNVYMDAAGEPKAIFMLRKIRQYPNEFGTGTLVESLCYPELAELGLHFFREIGYQGIGSIEFKQDDRDGKLKMIELNPRLWQQNMLATACGMNFPLIQYQDLAGKSLPTQVDFTEGVRWLDLVSDFQSALNYLRSGELTPWSWLKSYKGVKVFSTFALDDLGPYLSNTQYGLRYLRLPLYLVRNRQ